MEYSRTKGTPLRNVTGYIANADPDSNPGRPELGRVPGLLLRPAGGSGSESWTRAERGAGRVCIGLQTCNSKFSLYFQIFVNDFLESVASHGHLEPKNQEMNILYRQDLKKTIAQKEWSLVLENVSNMITDSTEADPNSAAAWPMTNPPCLKGSPQATLSRFQAKSRHTLRNVRPVPCGMLSRKSCLNGHFRTWLELAPVPTTTAISEVMLKKTADETRQNLGTQMIVLSECSSIRSLHS